MNLLLYFYTSCFKTVGILLIPAPFLPHVLCLEIYAFYFL